MGHVTHDQADLLLRLYELRREPRLREARAWFGKNFDAKTPEELNQKYPMGSEGNVSFRMVVSYWEMVAALVTAGVLNQDLFFQTNGELLFVWERVRELVPAFRAMSKNPNAWRNLEDVGNAFIKRMEANGPETYPAFQAMVRGAGTGR